MEMAFTAHNIRLDNGHYTCPEIGFTIEEHPWFRSAAGLLSVVISWVTRANFALPTSDAWNVAKYGLFDAVFCCGLLYHLDRPKDFLQLLSSITRRLLIVQTHFATERPNEKFQLSELTENESIMGRWYTEYESDDSYAGREAAKWAAWGNRRSFWPRREHLLQAIHHAGFDLIFEQFDGLGGNIVESMSTGHYQSDDRGTFVGIKVN